MNIKRTKSVIKLSGIFISALLLIVSVMSLFPVGVLAADSDNYYWAGGTGNWSDVSHWSSSDDGTGGDFATAPNSTNNVYFTANSFTGAGQIVTVDDVGYCKDMVWTGVTNSPTLFADSASAARIEVSGSITLGTMTVNKPYTANYMFSIKGNSTFNFTGATVTASIINTGAVTINLASDITNNGIISLFDGGTITTNNYNISCTVFQTEGASAETVTLGTSTLNCTAFVADGADTITGNHTIKVTGTGAFDGGGLTYYNVELNGTAHTVSGSNTFNELSFKPSGACAVSFTGGTTQTVSSLTRSWLGMLTLQSTNATAWTVTDTAGTNQLGYCTIKDSTANGGATFTTYGVAFDGGGNTGWLFPHTVSTSSADSIAMTKDGVTSGSFQGYLTDMGGANNTGYFEYGLTAAYGSTSSSIALTTIGSFTRPIPNNLTPGATYHFRGVAQNSAGTVYGDDATFTFTLPTIATGTSALGTRWNSVTLNGTVSNMGVASTTGVVFDYGYTPSFGSSTTPQTISGTGSVTTTITGLTGNSTLYYRIRSTNGAVSVNGSVDSYNVPAHSDIFTGLSPVILISPTLLVIGFIFGGFFMIVAGARRGEASGIIIMGIGVLLIGVSAAFIPMIISAFSSVLSG